MAAINLGINSASISYEVAVELLGQSRAPFMSAIREEQAKAAPSPEFLKYCNMRLAAIDELQDELRLEDTATIERILDRDGERNMFKTPLMRHEVG